MRFDELRDSLGGDAGPPYFVIHKGPEILALALDIALNPRILEDVPEVWVGAGQLLPMWGERLACCGSIPLFVSEGSDSNYQPRGQVKPVASSVKVEDLRAAEAFPGIKPLSRIVYLNRV
jgi:hypothetical protein